MGSSFFGFNIARSGLFVSQRALNVTAHNIANANTEGFSRQRLDTTASRPDVLPGSYGTLGTGVDSNAVKQIRDVFLDYKLRGESTLKGEWAQKEDVLSNIEAILNEPSESGISTVLDQFYSAIQELSKNPESLTTRALVRQRSIAFAKSMNQMSESLKKMQSDLDFELQAVTDEINGYAKQIASMNKTIYSLELEGGKANDMRDQRNLLVDKLSELTNIDYFEDSMGRFFVTLSGNPLVSHFNYDQLKLVERPPGSELHSDDAIKLNDISWESGATFNAYGGKLKGLLDMRDNIAGDDKGIPYYVEKLNEFSDTLASELNRIHASGYGLKGSTGIDLFTHNGMSTADYEDWLENEGLNGGPGLDVTSDVLVGTSASNTEAENQRIILQNMGKIIDNNPMYASKSIKKTSDGHYLLTDRIKATEITISSDIEKSLDMIAASKTLAGLPGDGSNGLSLASSRSNVYLYNWGSPDDFVKSLVSNLAVDTQEATRAKENQEFLIAQVENKRQSIMGVSMDEEMSEMLKFQHSYNANARMITTIDGMLETIINRLGLVGR